MKHFIVIISFFFLSSQSKDSFVISCGSGCAMVYNVEKIKRIGTVFKVKFKVSNYIDEKVVEETHQYYFFEYEKGGRLISIHPKASKENILIDKDDFSKDEFKKFGERLWKHESGRIK